MPGPVQAVTATIIYVDGGDVATARWSGVPATCPIGGATADNHGHSRTAWTVDPQVSRSAGSRAAAPQTSQADSAGSIPVTRSTTKAQVRTRVREPGPCCFTVVAALRAISRRSKAARCAGPLARRQRRALPWRGPPGARRATPATTRLDHYGILGPCQVTQLAAMSSAIEAVTAPLGAHGSQRHGRPERPTPGPIHPRSTESTQGPWSSGVGTDSPCGPCDRR